MKRQTHSSSSSTLQCLPVYCPKGETKCPHCVWHRYIQGAPYPRHIPRWIPRIPRRALYAPREYTSYQSGKFQYAFSVIAGHQSTTMQLLQHTFQVVRYLYEDYGFRRVRIQFISDHGKRRQKEHPHAWIILTEDSDKKKFDRVFRTVRGCDPYESKPDIRDSDCGPDDERKLLEYKSAASFLGTPLYVSAESAGMYDLREDDDYFIFISGVDTETLTIDEIIIARTKRPP